MDIIKAIDKALMSAELGFNPWFATDIAWSCNVLISDLPASTSNDKTIMCAISKLKQGLKGLEQSESRELGMNTTIVRSATFNDSASTNTEEQCLTQKKKAEEKFVRMVKVLTASGF